MAVTTPENRAGNPVLLVVGTRPEAIKMLPLIRVMRAHHRIDPIVISTGQHAELVAEVLGLAGIRPDVTLDLPVEGRTLNSLVAGVLTGLEAFVRSEYGQFEPTGFGLPPEGYPLACFVHGDTSSAAAAALAAFHLKIPVAHVEAGLRTSDTLSPYPEELNRQLISRIAALHFAPTPLNEENLIRERVRAGKVFVTGNTAIDALRWASTLRVPYGQPELAELEHDQHSRVIVVTAHRRENWDGGIARIAVAVSTLAERYPDVRFVVSLHPNPAVGDVLRGALSGRDNVSLVQPMDYLSFARLLDRAYLAITDSGGVQEEAPSLGTPVLVTRDKTERQEGVDAGTVELVGTDVERIVSAATRLLDSPTLYARRASRSNPFGDGAAAERIVKVYEHIAFGSAPPAPFGSGIERLEVLRAAGYAEDPAPDVAPPSASRLVGNQGHE